MLLPQGRITLSHFILMHFYPSATESDMYSDPQPRAGRWGKFL